MKREFFITFGVNNVCFKKTNISEIEIPDYIALYNKPWYSDFEEKIREFLLLEQVQPTPAVIRSSGKSLLVKGYHQIKALRKLSNDEKKSLRPLISSNLRKKWELEWLEFCLNYAIKGPYNQCSKLLTPLLGILKDKRSETLEHKKEKIKAIFWLLDSKVPAELISIERVWGNLVSDVAVEIPLTGLYEIFQEGSSYKEKRKGYFSLKFAIEIGKWHKKPSYLKWGIPFVWVPFRKTTDKELESFFKEVRKYNFYSFFIKHYVHIIDETFSGYLFLPKAEKTIREV